MRRPLVALFALVLLPLTVHAQWNPDNAQWRKSDATHLRVMTWNVADAICSTSDRKHEQHGNWHAIVCIVASLRPDVLILQEAGDNSGNGTGQGADSVADLTVTLQLFMYGGQDPFVGGEVTSFVQKYAPDYDLPHVFVSPNTDGFNRNVVMSRHPFADLNGDGKATYGDMPLKFADDCTTTGNGGIRGFQHAEIDLPDEVYAGDLVIGNSHLKAGGTQNDRDQRAVAADNIAYYIYYWYAGAGTGIPDPNNKITDNPPATHILSPDSIVIWGGDWNEDEAQNGSYRGPAARMVQGCTEGGNDGTDRDGSDAAYDDAREYFSGSRNTWSNRKLDYIGWWDSVATTERQIIFNSSQVPTGKHPPELLNYPNPLLASGAASDHRPVIVDFVLPLASDEPPGAFVLLTPEEGATDVERESIFAWTDSARASSYTLVVADNPALDDPLFMVSGLGGTAFTMPPDILDHATTYHWGVTAHNVAGQTDSTPFSSSFTTADPPAPGPFALASPDDGAEDVSRLHVLAWSPSSDAEQYELRVALDPELTDLVVHEPALAATNYQLVGGQLMPCTVYYWGVTARNATGERDSTPFPASFETEGVADIVKDGKYDTLDFLAFLNLYVGGYPEADLNLDGRVDSLDFLFFLTHWVAGC